MNLQLLNTYMIYMLGLILSFYLGFYVVLKHSYGYPFKTKIRYSITAGLLSTKFVIVIASLLGIDHLFFYLRIGCLKLPVTANLLLFISNLLAVTSLNWERIKPLLTVTEEEYERIFQY